MIALDVSATESSLRWGSPGVSRQANANHNNDPNDNSLRASVRRDAHLVMAAWEEDDAAAVRQAASEQQSIVVERTSPIYGEPTTEPSAYDPFDEDDRLAQLPDDPFDDPFDEPEGESTKDDEIDELPEEPIEDVEDALQQEMERRRSADDLFGEEMEESLEPETIDTDPSDELGDDPLGDDPLSDDPEDEELMQSEDDDWRTPDYDFGSGQQQELTPEQLRQRSEELQREQAESEENCSEELEKIEADTISSIDLSIRVPGNAGEDYPYECAVSTGTHQPRQWPQITYNWKAAAICHKPLYFEQVQLERYGHSWGPYVQPIMSGVHFFGTIPILPYKMGIRTPRECVYTLGYYRPGSCAPYMIDPIPFTWRAALFQGGAVTGISFAIP